MRSYRGGAVGAAILSLALVASACGSSGGGSKAAKTTITVGNQLTLGGPAECPTRKFCALGLHDVYGITFKGFRALGFDTPQLKDALGNGDVQVAELSTTDGTVADRGFVILQDDKHLQLADNVVPVVRTSVVTNAIRDLLNKVSAALTTEDLAQLDKKVDSGKQDPDVVAGQWAKDHGFSK